MYSQTKAGLPDYQSDLIESVQREALRISLPNPSYDQALVRSGLLRTPRSSLRTLCSGIIGIILSLNCLSASRTIKRQPWIRSPLGYSNSNGLLRTDRFITFKYGYNRYFCPCKFCNLVLLYMFKLLTSFVI